MRDVDKWLALYRELLLKANKKLNLVSRRDVDKRLGLLIEESLLPLRWEDCRLDSPLLDIGSGGGLPGIPLKIGRPDLGVTLLDANRRKTLFLRSAALSLGLTGVEVIWGRAEALADDPGRDGSFRTVVARGVGHLSEVARWGSYLLAEGGELIVWCAELDDSTQDGTARFDPPVVWRVKPGLSLLRLVRRRGD